MKKFALGILSVFMILGGVLLSGCDKKVSLSVSDKEVVLFTNYENAENNKSKEIEVDIKNSKVGVSVEIMHGQDCIDIERSNTVKKKANGKYAFKILTKQDKNSGVAQIKVSSIENSKKYEYINVAVNTVLEDMKVIEENSEEGKSNFFVVKGVDKQLVTTEYFDLLPIHANITDINWAFENGEKEFYIDDKLAAEIVGTTLKVSNAFTMRRLDVYASYALNTDITRKLTLEVLDNSTIRNYSVEDNVFYQNGVIQTTQATVALKRNNSDFSSATGTLVLDVNKENDLRLSPVVYKRVNGQSVLVSKEEYENYFIFDYTEKENENEGTKTYNISIDAIDNSAKNIFGQFEIFLQVDYAGYNYSVSTSQTKLVLDIAYCATIVELSDADGYSINNTFQDVFSSYETSYGYEVNTVIGPTEVAIDDRYFRITLDTNQEALRNLAMTNHVENIAQFFTADGTPIEFTQSATGSSIFVSKPLETGTKVFVKGSDKYDEIEAVEFKFESRSNSAVSTSLYFTFFKIAEDKSMKVESAGEEALEQITYLSSSVFSNRRIDYTVKISGIATNSGLSLKNDNVSGFEYSNLTLVSKSEENEEESFVVVSFSVNLTAYNFADVSTFWFEHVTGKKSEEFKIEAFVPIESLTIQNSDKSSSNVFIDVSSSQDYVLNNDAIESDPTKQSYSLSKLMLEAGTALPIYTSYQNATLTENGVSYKFMSFDMLKIYLSWLHGVSDNAELERLANEAIASGDINLIANSNAFIRFEDITNTTGFSISKDMLSVTNTAFKGYVAVLIEGFNENHETITLVRFFALESFYSVRFLSSNVRTTLLYTADTLSLNDINRSIVDVSISMRQDDNVPTYSDSLSYFTFTSALQDFYDVSAGKTLWKNDYYTVSNVSLANNGKNLTFRISAKSTNLQTSVKDVLRIVYRDEHGFEKVSEIQIEIKNVKRLESVQWVNRTPDNEIYLNLTTTNTNDKNFTISTSVEPSDANDIGLTSMYFATSGSASDIKISTSSIGQIFNVNINTTKGGKGYLYLLPNDMVKNVDGFNHVLVYKYVQNEDGSIKEIPVNIPLSNLNNMYEEIISGSEEISNYFFNNEGEKVYYKDIILKIAITIADGNSEGTAIRVYNQGDLEDIDFAKYYKVMNDITLSGWDAWESKKDKNAEFTGMIYGNDSNVTLKMTNGSKNFVNNLNGTIKDLVFVGDVTVNDTANAGFIANTIGRNGRIENCSVDVYYSNADNNYLGSKLNSGSIQNTGMIAGLNDGTIVNAYVYGGSINAPQSVRVGGLVGENNGLVSESGFEFYKFGNEENCNTITTAGNVGGLVGFAGGTSVVEKSYAYAYALATIKEGLQEATVAYSRENIIKAEGFVGAFASASSNGARFSQVFSFLGDVKNAFASGDNKQYTTLENSYVTYFDAEQSKVCSDIFKLVTYSFSNSTAEFVNGTDTNWVTLTDADSEQESENVSSLNLDENIWNLEKTDSEINFGYIYLKNVAQSKAVNLDEVHVEDSHGEYDERLRVLNSGDRNDGASVYESGILFMFNPVVNIADVQEKAMLDSLNTISVSTLFGITAQQAKGLLLTSESKNISLSANSIRLLNTSINEFEINVHSKMDFTQVKTFKFVILNILPTLSTMIDGVAIKDNQMILLQTGESKTIVYSTMSSLYLNGETAYALNKDDFTIYYSYIDGEETGNHVGVVRSSNSLVLSGLLKHENDNRTTIYTNLKHNNLSANADFANYANAVNDKISRTFETRVYNGAKKLEITNANNLIVRPSEYATFDVVMETDEQTDGLEFSLRYGQVDAQAQREDSWTKFEVDSNLSLEVSWALTSSTLQTDGVLKNRYKVFVKVSEDTKHLVVEDYADLALSVNALSHKSDSAYKKTINLKVETQKIEDFSISTYAVERRQIRNSILYLTPSSQILNTISPASDAIVSVAVTPQYAKMTHFTLTYEVSGSAVGTVGLSKLVYNSLYGYYVNSASSSVVPNGIRVNLTEADKLGDGVFYFRLYVSSSFASTSGLRLVTTFYNNDEVLMVGSQTLTVDYMQDAVVRVNDSSTYLLAKGETATVSVRVGIDQNLSSLYLQNNESKISLTAPTVEIVGNYKVYTAEVFADVDAKLTGGRDSGIFYVCATVERMLNNIQEIKTSRATVCLVDFSIDTKGISVVGSGNKRTYNGKSYDVFHAYINDKSELHFNYPVLPAEYNYDKNDSEAVEAVKKLTEKRNQFLNHNYYYDKEVGYYINYARDEETGVDKPITLKQQLWYATDESHTTAIYNANRDTITQNDYFNVSEETLLDGSTRIMISGKRAGTQLMKLQTVVNYQGIEVVADYYFLVVVEVWTDEESPTQITTAKEFIDYATTSEESGDYILMNDIVLSDYTPLNTALFNSLDGNGFTIHLNSFKTGNDSSLRLALFDTVTSNTTLKNIRVNIYNGGQIFVNIKQYSQVEIAGFALVNEGIIYNCDVVSYYDEKHQVSRNTGNSGLIVKFTDGANTDEIALSVSKNVESRISGFVLENNSSIMNSRVGGESFKHVTTIDGINYLQTQNLDVFYLRGQGEVSGFVNSNSGYISASFVKNIQIDNIMEYDASITAGFAVTNAQSIQNSYVEGLGGATEIVGDDQEKEVIYNNLTNISSLGVIAGFVYENNSLVKNSYANIAIENSKTKGAMVAGFVYRNNAGATVTLCYAACEIAKQDITQMQFSGVDDFSVSLNNGEISLSYFYNESRTDDTIQSKITTSAIAVFDVDQKNSFYGFSFSSEEGAYNGIWEMRDNGKITLVSANQIAISNRYAVTNGKITSIFYSKSIRDVDTLNYVDLSYGSAQNPIILRNATDFAKATGKATSTEISSYKEYYTDTEVTGRYRIVNNIDMTDIAQDAEDEGAVKLTTTTKVFRGLLDGNGFTISNISLGSSETTQNFGLFARMSGAVIMNLDLTVESVHNAQANIVGVLAGTAVNSRILAISLSPSETTTEGESTAVQGHNVVGGVVGMLFGESYLSDINVTNVDVSSEGYTEGKTIGANKKYIEGDGDLIKSLRELVEDLDNGLTLSSNVAKLSYAGAIAGFVDAYASRDEGFVIYSTSREVGDYDVVTVRVSNSVNIYAEVAGGLFGYVGKSTLIYDANLEINQNAAQSTQGASPSYIISKNLFAGGLVGENYGGMFAVSAKYEKELQETIELNENKYYNQSTDAEKGQMSIFSYTPNDEGFATRTNKPLFIGGLVGYMGGGYVYVGQSKLNVISHTGATAGGVVGLSGVSANKYDLTFTTEKKSVNTLYYEVYASGDVYSEGGMASGIIGALESTSNASGIIAMKNVMAVNYYSYAGSSLTGDEKAPTQNEPKYESDRHFMLVGGIFDGEKLLDKNATLYSDFYIINSINDIVLNLKDATTSPAEIGAFTVGGYKEITIGSATAVLKEFGFYTPAETTKKLDSDKTILEEDILKAQHVGTADFSTPAQAYARMKNYFTSNGWDEKYWTHEQDHLFPDIVLLPKIGIKFWDVDNTAEILQEMNGGSSTIVVRGRLKHDDDNCLDYQDIDLTGSIADAPEGFKKTVENFGGRLVSYSTYMNSQEGGVITSITHPKGGDVGEKVGIILNQALFERISGNATIEGLTFYLTTSDEKNGFSLVTNEAETALFRNVNIVVNDSMTLKTDGNHLHVDDGTYASIGLITGMATSTSFFNVNIRFRGESNITFQNDLDNSGNIYMGLLAGKIRQTSSHAQMSVNGISISRAKRQGAPAEEQVSEKPIDVKFSSKAATLPDGQTQSLNAGIYAGEISKSASGATITIGVRQINNVNLHIESESSGGLNDVNVGGYAGNLASADKVELVEGDSDKKDGSGISIYQNSNAKNLNAGLAFGSSSASVQFSFDRVPNAWLIGRLIQDTNATVSQVANIGSMIGQSKSTVIVSGPRVKFDVSKIDMYWRNQSSRNATEENKTIDLEAYENNAKTLLDNRYSYHNIGTKDTLNKLYAFDVGVNVNNAFGGIVGFTTGALTINGTTSISGNIIVKQDSGSNAQLAVGGVLGKYEGTNNITIGGNVSNTINVYINTQTAYVGGAIGNYSKDNATGDGRLEIGNSTSEYGAIKFDGHVVSDRVQKLYFGGAVGHLGLSTGKTSSIAGFAFGGALKVLVGEKTASSWERAVVAGGIVGTYATGSDFESQISSNIEKCVAFGDVFVIYPEYAMEIGENGLQYGEKYQNDALLTNYVFGGIVGSAQKGVSIKNCVSLLTDFNSQNSVTANVRTTANDNIGAIVGQNADSANETFTNEGGMVHYVGNQYSSIVTRTFQEQDGNVDCGYGTVAFEGYQVTKSSTDDNTETVAAGGEETHTAIDILDRVKGLVSDAETGHKLNPYKIENDNYADLSSVSGKFNNIKWVAVTDNLQGQTGLGKVLADSLVNIAIVGNGKNIEVKLNEDVLQKNGKVVYGGAIANTMGVRFDKNSTSNNNPNFNMISGIIVDLDVAQNIKLENVNTSSATNAFGGIVGHASGNSFIYGVGVKGELSVGGDAQLTLAGIVGNMDGGRIDQSYVDADIIYRGATAGGVVSGVANMYDFNSLVNTTYSSGKILSYVGGGNDGVKIYTIAYGQNNDSGVLKVKDCYSITQVERNDLFAIEKTSSVVERTLLGGTIVSGGNVVDATTSGVYALSYGDANKYVVKDFKYGVDDEDQSQSNTWFFSRLTNYGYASHGFGFLKNSTTYTRHKISVDGKETYEYRPVSYSDLLDNESGFNSNNTSDKTLCDNGAWYLGVPSASKFKQMVGTVAATIQGNNTSNVNEAYEAGPNYKFVLRYGFSLDHVETIGKNVGISGKDFVFDGNGNTIDFGDIKKTVDNVIQDATTTDSGLFGTVIGDVRNLRISNVNISSGKNFVGALAGQVDGMLEDITAIGNITIMANSAVSNVTAGGIVGLLQGSAQNISALVNIKNASRSGVVMGGIAGKLTNLSNSDRSIDAAIDYASNMGIIENTSTGENKNIGALKICAQILNAGTDVETVELDRKNAYVQAITGGIVGYAGTGTVSNSYNSNSVLSNFVSGTKVNVVSGGIVGYASDVTINECFNASLVGAGNYSNQGYSYAGGIVGFSQNLEMTNSVNDGAVQSLGYQDSDYKIKVEKVSGDYGEAVMSGYDTNPKDILYKITMTYNPDDYRHVNAYGLGFATTNGAFDGSHSTTNNVKNDGNVGEIQTVSYLLFNRNQMLSSDGSYEGNFQSQLDGWSGSKANDSYKSSAKQGLFISGVDSYGFPARVFAVDQIERRLVSSHPYYQHFYSKLSEKGKDGVDSSYNFGDIGHQEGYYVGYADVDSNYNIKPADDKANGSMTTRGNIGDYLYGKEKLSRINGSLYLSATTDYYTSSVLSGYWGDEDYMNFDGYDDILQHLNKFTKCTGTTFDGVGLVDNSKAAVDSTSLIGGEKSISDFVNSKIQTVNNEITKESVDSDLKFINVAGTEVGVANKSSHITAILTPYSVELDEIEFNVAGIESINESLITKNSVRFNCNGGIEYQFAEFDIVKQYDSNNILSKVKVVGVGENAKPKLYFAQSVNQTISVELNIKGGMQFKLDGNNCKIENNVLILRKGDLSESVQKDLEKYSDDPTKYSFKDATIGNLKGLTVRYENEQLKISGTGISNSTPKENLNGEKLNINVVMKYSVTTEGDIGFTVSPNVKIDNSLVGKEASDFKFTFNNFNNVNKKAFANLTSFAETASGKTISVDDFIRAIGFTKSDVFAYNISGEYDLSAYWDGTKFAFASSAVSLSQQGNDIIVNGSQADAFINWASTQTASVSVLITDVENYNVQEDKDNPSDIGTLNSSIFDGMLILKGDTKKTADGFEMVRLGGGGFEAWFNGSNAEYESLSKTDNINPESLTIGSLTADRFKTVEVSFKYEFSAQMTAAAQGKTFSLEIERNEVIIDIKYFGGYFNNAGSQKIENIKLGDRLIYRDASCSFEIPSGTLNWDISVGGDEKKTSSITIRDLDDDKKHYSAEKGQNSIFNFEQMKYVTTKGRVIKTDGQYDYTYTVWENGIIEVEYIEYSKNGAGIKNYIYLPMNIDAGLIEKEVVVDEETKTVTTSWNSCSAGFHEVTKQCLDSDNNVIESNEDEENAGVFIAKVKYEFGEGVSYEDFMSDEKISVDLIVMNFNKDGISVVSARNEKSLSVLANYSKYETEDLPIEINLRYGNERRVQISGADNVQIKYKHGENAATGEYKTCANGTSFSEKGYYSVEWSASLRGKNSNNDTSFNCVTSGSSTQGTASVVLLNSDISVDGYKDTLQKRLIGSNYILRFVTSGTKMFGNISKSMNEEIDYLTFKDVILAGSNSGGADAFFANLDSSAKVINVKLFGSMRNISSNRSGNVFADYTTQTTSRDGTTQSAPDLKNNVSVIGLNAPQNAKVDVVLQAHNHSGRTVLIAGDAVKSSNANETYNLIEGTSKSIKQYISSEDHNGSDGLIGQLGGNVEIVGETNTGDNIKKDGLDSIGGYGGDGAHGFLDIGLGGGKAGKRGENADGANGFRKEGLKQYNGNSGIGGFGRIVQESDRFKMYSSGNGGNLSEAGSNGCMRESYRSGDKFSAYFGATYSSYCNTKDHKYTDHWEWSAKYKGSEWYGTVDNEFGSEMSDTSYLDAGGVSGQGGGNSVYAKKIYIYCHIHIRYVAGNIWVPDGRSAKYAWTSGEPVNGAGGFSVGGK